MPVEVPCRVGALDRDLPLGVCGGLAQQASFFGCHSPLLYGRSAPSRVAIIASRQAHDGQGHAGHSPTNAPGAIRVFVLEAWRTASTAAPGQTSTSPPSL